MCGLVSVISKYGYGFNKEQVDVFDTLLYADALRGMDSTGVFMVDRDGTMELAKEASASYDFRQHKDYLALKSRAIARGVALVGHNRAATKGSITDENAHPFVVDDRITLVHNGTLYGDHKKLANTEVDSHAIAHTIHNKGDDVEAALQELSGAYALIWHDFTNKTINFVRNAQRPLHWFETDNAWYWASEANMLYWMMARFNLKPHAPIAPLKEGTLVTYTQGTDNKFTVTDKEITLTKPYTSTKTSYDNWPLDDGYGCFGVQRLANGYYRGCENDEDETPTQVSNVLALPQPSRGATPSPRDLELIQEEEEKLAATMDIAFSFPTFSKVAQHITTGTYVNAVFMDYIPVIKENAAGGWYLYAQMEDEPDLIVKAFLSSKTTEEEIIDLCYNKKTARFHMTTKHYRTYTGKRKQNGDGYGIFSADAFTIIPARITTLENSEL